VDQDPASLNAGDYSLAEWDAIVDGPIDWALIDEMRCCRKAELEARLCDGIVAYEHLSETRQRWVRAALARGIAEAQAGKEARRERWHGAWGGDNPRKGRDVVTSKRFSREHVLRITRRLAFERRSFAQGTALGRLRAA
jgi:hypothetical protein